MIRNPNNEQHNAISSDGGVLLQAGAGSGKTYVIIEHVIYKLENWIKQFNSTNAPDEDFLKFIKEKMSGLVLMTFTNLASGEMSIRLEDRIKYLKSNDNDTTKWEVIYKLLNTITITTIHGFCFKLIKQGFFKDINVESKLINQEVLKLFIGEQFSLWLRQKINDKNVSRSLLDKVLVHRKIFLDAITAIIKDSVVLSLWQNAEKVDSINIWKSLTLYFSPSSTFAGEIISEEYLKTKWGLFLNKFQKEFPQVPECESDLKALFDYFHQLDFKIPPARFAKNVPDEVKEMYYGVRDLKDFFKKQSLNFESYWDTDSTWAAWNDFFKEAVEFVLTAYRKTNLMTFSDIEYLVWLGLKDEESKLRVSTRYDYLIVDEFQDTSKMQYEIILDIVNGQLSQLFLVGDLKQAIYGFRGGEISVFRDCAKQISDVKELVTNYRSQKKIIDFNNKFFSELFQKNYNEHEKQSDVIAVEPQISSEAKKNGQVTLVKCSLSTVLDEEYESLTSEEVEKIEAAMIRKYIQDSVTQNSNFAVLYRKLAPSKYLIEELSEHGLGFTTQAKIQLNDDPILAVFNILVEGLLDTGGKHFIYCSFIIDSLMAQLNIYSEGNHPEKIQKFYNNINYFGLKNAFLIFLNNMHLSIPNFKESILIIEEVIEHNGGDIEGVYVSLREMLQKNYSLNLKFGHKSERITIMTTHSSKGLQFEKVIVGGIYTNDFFIPNNEMIGKLPRSFQWSDSETSKDKYKTPFFIWENENAKRREFHESKRLFYVACTRAEEELAFIDIDFEEVKLKRSSSRSWYSLLKQWRDINEFDFDNHNISLKVDLNNYPEFELPLFHTNDLGIIKKNGDDSQFAIIPELSTTRLITVDQCPKKFYFQNICKFDEGNSFNYLQVDQDDEIRGPISSKKRGTEFHEYISTYIKANYLITQVPKHFQEKMNWLGINLKQHFNKHILVSERLIKFSFFGHMMTAIPDLFILDKDRKLPVEVWDFKTGNKDESSFGIYFQQLRVYAYALSEIYELSENYKIKLVICYIDEGKFVDKITSIQECKNQMFKVWEKIQSPWVENLIHCKVCGYKNICQA